MKGKLSESRGPGTDTQESVFLLTAYDDHVASHTENTGGSGLDCAAIRRNEQDGENIVHKPSPHVLIEYSMQEIMGRGMITSLKTNDN